MSRNLQRRSFSDKHEVSIVKRLAIAALRSVKHRGFGNTLNFLGNVRTGLAVDNVFLLREETGVTFAVIGRGVLESSLAQGFAQVADERIVDGLPGRLIGWIELASEIVV